jgi:hypothetical protein
MDISGNRSIGNCSKDTTPNTKIVIAIRKVEIGYRNANLVNHIYINLPCFGPVLLPHLSQIPVQ